MLAPETKCLFFKPNRFQYRPTIGISACLRGEKVRYDGADKYATVLATELSEQVNWLALCPEVTAGMGVPRPPVQILQLDESPRVVGRDDPTLDVTDALAKASTRCVDQLSQSLAVAYIFQERSPSCGLGSTPLFDQAGQLAGLGNGLFAQAVKDQLPELLCLESDKLLSDTQCQNFLLACQLMENFRQALNQEPQQTLEHFEYLYNSSDSSIAQILSANGNHRVGLMSALEAINLSLAPEEALADRLVELQNSGI